MLKNHGTEKDDPLTGISTRTVLAKVVKMMFVQLNTTERGVARAH